MKESEVSKEDEIPPGCSRYTVQLSKPLGLVLEETQYVGSICINSLEL